MDFAHFFQHLPWITIFGLLGNTISFMVFLSPIPTFYRIYKKKSTEEFQSIPYVIAFFSCILWLLYAFVKTDVIFLVTINSFGLFIETIYIAIFLVYANKKTRISTFKQILLFNVFGFGVIVFFTMVIAKTTRVRLLILGWICLIFSLCVFVAPLGVMRKVIRTKSVEYMPFFLSFFLTISAVVWFFYGLLKHDYYIAIPNVLGFTFGIVQMILYAIYRNPKTIAKDIEVGKTKDTSTDQIIIEEPVKPQAAKATTTPTNDGLYAIQIPNLNMLNLHNNNNGDEPMKISGLNNHTPPPISVAV
ncbi:bidirectional sugar transporter SWEET12-like [Chenopodium quinoa]|uniref:bidirectional sugar transporter SWEET12-like n=1 Tax=Chenopodium quinoa TaxID=63459 RepID=UPI000B783CB6|nr:bidirectional sugar transporter SWEET12-like [Chenopodium quinoa]